MSMDTGSHRPHNQRPPTEVIDFPLLPKKCTCSAVERAGEDDPGFIQLRRQHSAVESAIKALEVHRLDCCRDRGLDGLKRYNRLGGGGAQHPAHRHAAARASWLGSERRRLAESILSSRDRLPSDALAAGPSFAVQAEALRTRGLVGMGGIGRVKTPSACSPALSMREATRAHAPRRDCAPCAAH
jgi:hypothetical protein